MGNGFPLVRGLLAGVDFLENVEMVLNVFDGWVIGQRL